MTELTQEVKERINKRFDKLFKRTDSGLFHPYVCLICDELLKPENVKRLDMKTLDKNSAVLQCTVWNSVPSSLAACYTYSGDCGNDADESIKVRIQEMLLSPRACYIRNGYEEGFSVCSSCKYALQHSQMPKYAIANNYCVGSVPQCILDLTEVERALLTPVKTYGYCFSYTGGIQKQLKGSLSYYKVKFESIARAVSHFDVLGLTDNVVVLLYGEMTPEQKRKAQQKNKVRTRYVVAALEWLVANNEEWRRRRINLDEVRLSLRDPVLIDKSKSVDSAESVTNSNIESTETFQVFFPDGTMSSLTGGQESLEKFQELVQATAQSGYDLDFRASLMKEAVQDFKDSNLVNACLLQFPYGRGGVHEVRLKGNGSFTENTDIMEYVEHLSRLSQTQFHHELFTLVLYNLAMRQTMVKNAGFRVRNKADARMLAEEITVDDVTEAIGSARLNGGLHGASERGNSHGQRFLTAVDTIAAAVPHTNEAATKARLQAESMQHHFGTPSYFLTVVPDDDNSFLVQVYSQIIIDDDRAVSTLSDEELVDRAKQRTQLRIKYPGICAYFFEAVLDIVIEEVIGWDVAENAPRNGVAGLFGVPKAFTASIEEQGRKTLHCHMLIWVEGFNKLREEGLHSQNVHSRRIAEKSITDAMDRIGGCSLISCDRQMSTLQLSSMFPHVCSVENCARKRPVVVSDQRLRDLRHKDGYAATGGVLAYCSHCSMTWTSTELLESYLKNKVKVPGLRIFPDTETRRLKAMAVEYQKDGTNDSFLTATIIDAAYNHHSHTVSSCFGKSGKKKSTNAASSSAKKRKLGNNYECRYRYPQRKKRRTIVQDASQSPVKWYLWNGTHEERFIKEVCVKRQAYDAYQNVSCHAISQSKLSCNTNVSPIMPGPVGQYVFKYNMKNTQEDDTEEYERVAQATQKVLSKHRTHESDRSEAVKRLLAASFAHQKTNVVGGSMASYLTRNKSRFLFSHKTVWCPLRDIKGLLKGERVDASIEHSGSVPFFKCMALDYLCRPLELENYCAFDFYTLFEVVRLTSRTEGECLQFHNALFDHPSYRCSTDTFIQGVRYRREPRLVKVLQHDFPDTADFGGSLLDQNHTINQCMESYCEQVLSLFYPLRHSRDISLHGSFTLRFREAVASGIIGETAFTFLQNIQDCKANSFRLFRIDDDLQRNTEPFHANGDVNITGAASSDPDEDVVHADVAMEGQSLDEVLALLDMEAAGDPLSEHDQEPAPFLTNGGLPSSISVASIRQKGAHKCGYECLADMSSTIVSDPSPLIQTQPAEAIPQHNDTEQNAGAENHNQQRTPSQRDIVNVLISRKSRRSRTFQEISTRNEQVDVLQANGSVRSIIDWAKKAGLDRGQRRAFEIITATFILTFFSDAACEEFPTATARGEGIRHPFIREKKLLELLADVRNRGRNQLICLLHGPGGSGKTAVIDLLMEYAREYCSYIENFEFTSRTIVVTAMTGVAATILLGETTHSAAYLNQKRPIDAEQVELWASARMIIIDEISFASKDDFIELHRKLRELMQRIHVRYGGLNVIFAGDFRQLEPIGVDNNGESKKPVYAEGCPEFKEWINCFVELNGMHRFKDDPEWGYVLFRFRDGTVTIADIDMINAERVVDSQTTTFPENMKYATYFNRDRDSINAALFQERCRNEYETTGSTNDSIMIFCDGVQAQNASKTYTPFRNTMTLWEHCGEDDVKPSRAAGRMDPVLRLYRHCRVMLPANSDVTKGQANGTQATFEGIVLKPGEQPHQVLLDGNVPVAAVRSTQVAYISLRHCNDRIRPSTFSLRPKEYTFKAKILKPHVLQVKGDDREVLQMKATQLPILINNATTGHRLQGSGVDSLFVHNWSYVQNWVYVMLSRVKTRAGLFCRKPLSKDLTKYAVPQALQAMLHYFRTTKSPTSWTDEEYEDLFDLVDD